MTAEKLQYNYPTAIFTGITAGYLQACCHTSLQEMVKKNGVRPSSYMLGSTILLTTMPLFRQKLDERTVHSQPIAGAFAATLGTLGENIVRSTSIQQIKSRPGSWSFQIRLKEKIGDQIFSKSLAYGIYFAVLPILTKSMNAKDTDETCSYLAKNFTSGALSGLTAQAFTQISSLSNPRKLARGSVTGGIFYAILQAGIDMENRWKATA